MTESLLISTEARLDANSTTSQTAPSKTLALLVALAIAAAQPPMMSGDPGATASVMVPHAHSVTSSWTALSASPIDVHVEVEQALVGLAARLAREQIDLSPEDSALLYGNLWQLYG